MVTTELYYGEEGAIIFYYRFGMQQDSSMGGTQLLRHISG
jgi:hypothetical protein